MVEYVFVLETGLVRAADRLLFFSDPVRCLAGHRLFICLPYVSMLALTLLLFQKETTAERSYRHIDLLSRQQKRDI